MKNLLDHATKVQGYK